MMFVSAIDYDRFMGRYSKTLAREFARFAGVKPESTALDVGCGPGALTDELVRILGTRPVVRLLGERQLQPRICRKNSTGC